jgi:hypothetical protein
MGLQGRQQHHTRASDKEGQVQPLNVTDNGSNGQARGPPGAAVLDADPPVDGSVATGHPPGPDQVHDHAATLVVTIGDECPADLARIVLPLDISTKQTTNRPQEEPMAARSTTSPAKTRSGGSSPRRRENRKKTTAADPGATTRSEDQLDDQTWLASFPIRQKLADPTAFDREALLRRHTWPEVERMIRQIEAGRPGLLEEVAEKAFPLCWYAHVLMTVIRWPHPDTWHICPNCNGRGRKGSPKETCYLCIGTGYCYDTWLERRAGLRRR